MSTLRGGRYGADAGSLNVGEISHSAALKAPASEALILRVFRTLFVGVLVLQATLFVIAIGTTLRYGPYEVSYLPNDIASAVGDPAGLFDFNGLEVTSSSWHFVLEPAGTRRRLTESEWDAAQASMRADVLAEAEAIHRSACLCGGSVAPTAAATPGPTSAPSILPTPDPTPVPSMVPTPQPSLNPSPFPSPVPTPVPAPQPTPYPTPSPTAVPMPVPTRLPTFAPTVFPSLSPIPKPSLFPVPVPTSSPTVAPTYKPVPKPTIQPTIAPSASPSVTKQPSASPTSTSRPSYVPSLSPTTADTFTMITSINMLTEAIFEPGYTSPMQIAVANQLGVEASLVSNLAIEDAVTGPCGCEVDGVYFCNFDDGATGTCEDCTRFPAAEDCLKDGLPEAGAMDCTERCHNVAYDVTFVETSFSYSYNYTDDLVISTSRRLLQQLPTAAPTPFPSLLRSDSPSKAPSTMAPTSSPTEKPFYLWFVSFDVTQSLANSGHLSAASFLDNSTQNLQRVDEFEAEIKIELNVTVDIDSGSIMTMIATRNPSAAPSNKPSPVPSTTNSPSNEPTLSFAPAPNPTLSPTSEDTVTVAITLRIFASAPPTTKQESALKTTVARTLGVPLSVVRNFAISTSARLLTSGSSGDVQVGDLESPRRRLLEEVTWTVTFEVTQSLSSTTSTDSTSIATDAETELTSSEFEAAVANSTGTNVTVDETSLETVVYTRNPSSVPSLRPTAHPSLPPTVQPSVTPQPSLPPTISFEPSPSPTSSRRPTTLPTIIPSPRPTAVPTSYPSNLPSLPPTFSPTTSFAPTTVFPPTPLPTVTPHPSTFPTLAPTTSPTMVCPAGTYYVDAALAPPSCEPCEVGKYSNVSKPPWATACTSCEAGRYADSTGSSFCELCRYGTAQSDTGSSSCVDCPGGQYEGTGAAICSGTCEAGKYSTGGARNCTYCPSGFKQSAIGKSSCDACPTGQLASEDRTSCYSCPAGTFVENSASCADCDAGRYAPTAQVDACLDCEAGSSTGVDFGAATCTKCAAGTYSEGVAVDCADCPTGHTSGTAAEECYGCEPGKYNNAVGSGACTDCAAGKYEVQNSSIACDECPAGQSQVASGQLSCTDCIAGSYNPGTGMSSCVDCPGDTYSEVGATVCDSCLRGYFYSTAGSCIECPDSTTCDVDGASTQRNILINEGYWRITPITMEIRQCPLPEGCLGGSNFSNLGLSYCNEGYMGPLCATCVVPGFFYNPDFRTCDACDSGGKEKQLASPTPVIVGLLFLLIIIGAVSMMCIPPKKKTRITDEVVQETESIVKKASAASKFVATWIRWAMKLRKKAKKAAVKVKALMAFSQISVNIQFNCDIKFPLNYQKMLDTLAIANLDLIPSLGMQCWLNEFDYISSMISVTVMPLLMASVLGLAYMTVGLCKPRPKHSTRKLREKYVVPPPLQDVFPPVAIQAFRRTFAVYDKDFSGSVDLAELTELFAELGHKIPKEQIAEMMKEVDLSGDNAIDFGEFLFMMHLSRNRNRHGTTGLAEMSYEVEAKANLAHGQVIFYLFLLLTFCVLISCSTTLFHYFKCNYFDEAEEYLGERKAWLYKDYSIDCYSTRYINYMLYAALMILVYPIGIPLTYYLLLRQHRFTLSDANAIAREAKEDYPTIGHLIFLVESYKPEYYYFEVIEVVRRLLLASVIGVVEAKSAAAPTIGLLICFIFLYIFIDFKPFKNPSDCNLGIILQYSIALFFLSALLIKVNATWDSADDQKVFGYFLMAVLFLGPLMITGQLIGTYIKVKRRTRAEKLAETVERENKFLNSQGHEGVDFVMDNVDVDEGVIDVANHIGSLDDGKKVAMARWCKCGNVYRPDTVFCRKCGTRRPIGKSKAGDEAKKDQADVESQVEGAKNEVLESEEAPSRDQGGAKLPDSKGTKVPVASKASSGTYTCTNTDTIDSTDSSVFTESAVANLNQEVSNEPLSVPNDLQPSTIAEHEPAPMPEPAPEVLSPSDPETKKKKTNLKRGTRPKMLAEKIEKEGLGTGASSKVPSRSTNLDVIPAANLAAQAKAAHGSSLDRRSKSRPSSAAPSRRRSRSRSSSSDSTSGADRSSAKNRDKAAYENI